MKKDGSREKSELNALEILFSVPVGIVGAIVLSLGFFFLFPEYLPIWLGSISTFWRYAVNFFIWYTGAYIAIKLLRRKADMFGNLAPCVSMAIVYMLLWLISSPS